MLKNNIQTTTLPTVGYTVFWRLTGIEVHQEDLGRLMSAAGLASALPKPPTARVALRRALVAWIAERAASGAGPAPGNHAGAVSEDAPQRALIRVVNQPERKWMMFALIAEDVDLGALGLTYGTNLRLFLHKETHEVRVTTEATGLQDAVAEAREVAAELNPYYQRALVTYESGDLSRLVRDLVMNMNAVSLRDGGGLYFVPETHAEALHRLRNFIEALPTKGDREPSFITVPQVDDNAARRQLARAVHEGLLDELGALHTDLQRFVAQAENGVKVRERTIQERLSNYRALKGRAQTYADLLGMQQEQVEAQVAALEARARAVLDLDTEDGEEETDSFFSTLQETPAPAPATDKRDAPAPAMAMEVEDRRVAVTA